MDELDAVVVGAGVVGLAVARALAQAGRDVVVLEADGCIGNGTSSRNSEVIHAGIYYPRGSLKARHCVAGRALLYDYLRERSLPHRRCGKLIVATGAGQEAALETVLAAAHANGVDDVVRLAAAEAIALEPALRCTAALSSPSTGIVDSHALMVSLHGDLERERGVVVFDTPVTGGACGPDGIRLSVGGRQPMQVRARALVNCAGLGAWTLAHALAGLPGHAVPPRWLAKGNYFSLSRRAPFGRLIYPLPQEGGLGVHLTLDLAGRARFGPDVEWVDAIDYAVDPRRCDGFEDEIRAYWPGLPAGGLEPAYAGIRPKLSGPGMAPADFRIDGPAEHGVPGLVNLYGIESPGLTACLSIARDVVARLTRRSPET